MYEPNDYPRTWWEAEAQDQRAAERAWEKEHECKRKGCEAAVDETTACGICEEYFCADHLYDGLCAKCFEVDEAADALIAERKAA